MWLLATADPVLAANPEVSPKDAGAGWHTACAVTQHHLASGPCSSQPEYNYAKHQYLVSTYIDTAVFCQMFQTEDCSTGLVKDAMDCILTPLATIYTH